MRNGRSTQRGFTYIAVLILVALMGGGLAAYGELASHARQREKEADLIWIRNQFREAIGLYYQRSPGTLKKYPEKIEDLLEDRRFLTRQRYLRKIYTDPWSGKSEWGLIRAHDGGIAGVFSVSEEIPQEMHGRIYRDLQFIYTPP